MEKIKKLRQFFKKEEIDGYLISKNDEFFGEYLPQLKLCRGFANSDECKLNFKGK